MCTALQELKLLTAVLQPLNRREEEIVMDENASTKQMTLQDVINTKSADDQTLIDSLFDSAAHTLIEEQKSCNRRKLNILTTIENTFTEII